MKTECGGIKGEDNGTQREGGGGGDEEQQSRRLARGKGKGDTVNGQGVG